MQGIDQQDEENGAGDFTTYSPQPQPTSESTNNTTWFRGFRTKVATGMAEWLKNSLGLGQKNSPEMSSPTIENAIVEPTDNDYYSDGVHGIAEGMTLHPPDLDFTGSGDVTPVNDCGPDYPGSEAWEMPNFWLNLEPGRESGYNDTLEMQHFGPLEGLVIVGNTGLGSGHEFHVVQLSNPTWCDKCGDFIWGFYKQAVRCSGCNYTCHYKCRMLVTLDCQSLSDSAKTASTLSCSDIQYLTAKSAIVINGSLTDDNLLFSHKDTEVMDLDSEVEIEECTGATIAKDSISLPQGDELAGLIEEYNLGADGLGMNMMEDGCCFSGYLQIHMNFTRPINIVAGQRPPSIYDVIKPEDTLVVEAVGAGDGSERRTITSFFLPRNTVKILHLTSDTTTREMIANLLKKFKVADNPLKFAVYERHFVAGETLVAKLNRVSDDACPLQLALQWGSNSGKRFVLQENDTGDIMWDAFEIPELNNFIKILDLEEQQYVWQIQQRYNLYRHYLQLECRERGLKFPPKSVRPRVAPPPPPPASMSSREPKKTAGGDATPVSAEAKDAMETPVWVKRDRETFNTMSTADSLRHTAQNTLNSQNWDYYSGTL